MRATCLDGWPVGGRSGVLGVPDGDCAGLGGGLDAVVTAAAAVAGLTPSGRGHVHRSSASRWICSLEALRGRASDLRLSNVNSALATAEASSIVCPSVAVARKATGGVSANSAMMKAP